MCTKFTIVTVCLNSENTIEKTLLSVANQTYKEFEYIVVDGESKDDTLKIINKYKKSITKLVSEKDNGIYDAMNKGIDLANNEWICFLNSGDFFKDKHVLEKLYDVIKKNDASIFYSDCEIINKNDEIISLYKTNHLDKKFHQQSTFYKKNLHNKYGYFINSKKSTISDYIFFCQINSRNFYKVNFIISVYRNDGVSNTFFHGIQRNFFDFFMGYISLNDLFFLSFKSFKFFSKKIKNYFLRKMK